MREHFRPYTLVSQMSGNQISASAITLKDTAGNPLKCNYISVTASGIDANADFVVQASSVGLNTPTGPGSGIVTRGFPTASGVIGQTSGFVGGAATVSKGIVEFVLSDADRVSEIQIASDSVEVCNYFITYGQVQTGNPLRDNDRPIGQ